MNVYELIYLYFMKDDQAFHDLYRYYFPLVVTLMSRQMSDMYHVKDEMLEIAQQVLFECLEKCRVDCYWQFTSYFKKCLQNRWRDYYNYEKRHDIFMKYETVSLDSAVKENSNIYHYEVIDSGKSLHKAVMMKLERERLDCLASEEFSYLELHILSLRRMGMEIKEIANYLQVQPAKVRSTLSKLKKWYALH